MAPVHDTDLENERWSQDEWRYFELWEKVEKRLRKKQRKIILLTMVVALIFSSVPVWIDRSIKWKGLSAIREVASLINHYKKESALQKRSFQLEFLSDPKPHVNVVALTQCQNGRILDFQKMYPLENFNKPSDGGSFRFLASEVAEQLGLPGATTSICLDHLTGVQVTSAEGQKPAKITPLSAIILAPVKDLATSRLDRVSILMMKGKNGDISFN